MREGASSCHVLEALASWASVCCSSGRQPALGGWVFYVGRAACLQPAFLPTGQVHRLCPLGRMTLVTAVTQPAGADLPVLVPRQALPTGPQAQTCSLARKIAQGEAIGALVLNFHFKPILPFFVSVLWKSWLRDLDLFAFEFCSCVTFPLRFSVWNLSHPLSTALHHDGGLERFLTVLSGQVHFS